MIDTAKIKKYVLPNLPYALIYWFFSKTGEAYRLAPGRDAVRKLIGCMTNLNDALLNPIPTLNPYDILIGLTGAAAIYGIVLYKKKNAKKWRRDIEYGSARWGNRKDICLGRRRTYLPFLRLYGNDKEGLAKKEADSN